jgi:hypothetical protein
VEVRSFKIEDYDMLCEWWKAWGWTPPPADFLPSSGFVVESNGSCVCAGFAYLTNSKVGWSEFVISSKDYKEDDRSECLDLLIDTINIFLKQMNYKYVFTSVKHKGLIDRYKNHGFALNDECVEMSKVL